MFLNHFLAHFLPLLLGSWRSCIARCKFLVESESLSLISFPALLLLTYFVSSIEPKPLLLIHLNPPVYLLLSLCSEDTI